MKDVKYILNSLFHFNCRVKNTPGHAGWDDDTPDKFSSWDLPTPGSRRREDDASIRSEDLKWDKPSTRRDKYNRSAETQLHQPSYDSYDKLATNRPTNRPTMEDRVRISIS